MSPWDPDKRPQRYYLDVDLDAPPKDLGVPGVAARTMVVRARRAPYCFLVHHWTSSRVPTTVIASLELVRCLPGCYACMSPPCSSSLSGTSTSPPRSLLLPGPLLGYPAGCLADHIASFQPVRCLPDCCDCMSPPCSSSLSGTLNSSVSSATAALPARMTSAFPM